MTRMDESTNSEGAGEQVASELMPTARISGDDESDTILLPQMSEEARRYIGGFSWCTEILESYFGGGIGGIFAVFLFKIRPSRQGVDEWIWIVVGDIPPAYIPLADCKSPRGAFKTYVHGMTKWVELARQGKTGTPDQGMPPVKLPATPEWAEKINQKLYGLTLTVKSLFEISDQAAETRH